MFAPDLSPEAIIRHLNLTPLMDGVFSASSEASGGSTYYLLTSDGYLMWHRHACLTTWHWRAGAPCALTLSPNGHDASAFHLRTDADSHEIPSNYWVSIVSLGTWTLVSLDKSQADLETPIEFAPYDWYPQARIL